MSTQGNGSRRVWTADEIEQQLDQVALVVARGARKLVKGFFFGAPQPPKPQPEKDRRQS